MRILLATFLLLLLFAAPVARAAPTSWDYSGGILQPLQSMWTAVVKAAYFQATSTTASIFPLANITKLSNLTNNGFVKTSSGDGTLIVDTNSYLTSYDAFTHPSATTFATTTAALSLPNSGFIGFMGNVAVDTTNYSLFGNTTLTLLNARSGASIGFRIANADVANFTTTGGFGFGATYYNLDPGQNNIDRKSVV